MEENTNHHKTYKLSLLIRSTVFTKLYVTFFSIILQKMYFTKSVLVGLIRSEVYDLRTYLVVKTIESQMPMNKEARTLSHSPFDVYKLAYTVSFNFMNFKKK